MQKYIRLIILLSVLEPVIIGQSFNNNPYSRYGIGELNNSGFAYNRSLGGSGIALRQTNIINPLNPASYTSQDTLSFLFQTGVSAQRSHIITDIDEDDANTMKVEYLAMGFPITRWFKFSLGLIPYNRVSYYYMEYQQIGDDIAVENHGIGGFNDFYLGGSIQPFKFLSLGFNASYLFGKISSYQMVDIPNHTVAGTRIREEYNASDFRYTTGIQLHPVFTDKGGHKHRFVLGTTYDIPATIDLNYNSLAARNFPSQVSSPILDTFRIVVDSAIQMKLPARLALVYRTPTMKKLMFTLEYTKQQFSEGIGMRVTADLKDYTHFGSVPIIYRFLSQAGKELAILNEYTIVLEVILPIPI
jgi:hypothetical protein